MIFTGNKKQEFAPKKITVERLYRWFNSEVANEPMIIAFL